MIQWLKKYWGPRSTFLQFSKLSARYKTDLTHLSVMFLITSKARRWQAEYFFPNIIPLSGVKIHCFRNPREISA